MADRGGHQRGGRGGGRGDHRGGRGGGRGGAHNNQSHEKPKKENILDLAKYMDKKIVVKFTGGREGRFLVLTLWEEHERTSGLVELGEIVN